jgi:uncharacterized protein YaeQ
MALKSTIRKATLHISDMDRHYYQEHQLTIAQHPSETDERLMVRVLAFALHADEHLEFGKGIGAEGEPALYRQDLSGTLMLIIEIGLPDERRIRQACGRADQVVVITYGRHCTVDLWWRQNKSELSQRKNLTVIQLPAEATQAMAALADRTMHLSCNIEDEQISLMNETVTVIIEPVFLLRKD